MVKNSKYIILSIILIVVVFISVFLIYVHNIKWIETDFYQESSKINSKIVVVSEFKRYNAIIRSNLFLFITNDESFYSGDSIQIRLKQSEFKLDSLLKNNDGFFIDTRHNQLISINDSLNAAKVIFCLPTIREILGYLENFC
jgi:hypothetical protein